MVLAVDWTITAVNPIFSRLRRLSVPSVAECNEAVV